MASLEEIRGILTDSQLRNKITAAVGAAADTVRLEDVNTANHNNRLIWARLAFKQPKVVVEPILRAVIFESRAFTVAQILGATDASIEAAVLGMVDFFADGSTN